MDRGADLSSSGRTIGVGAIVSEGGKALRSPPAFYFRLHREFDRTGTFFLGRDLCITQYTYADDGSRTPAPGQAPVPLKADTVYRVRLGTLVMDDAFPDDEMVADREIARRLPPAKVWIPDLLNLPEESAEAQFRTFPAGSADTLNFLMGSCRYPGLLWGVKRSDRIFGPMADLAKGGAGSPRFTLMTGDQIYADMFNRVVPVGRADDYVEFQDRYANAFGSPNMRRLLRSMPSYMILDDHEIEDNWAQDRIRDRRKRVLFTLAIGAYMSYQWSHGPRTWDRLLYYKFDCAGFPFFALDTRTQRYKDDRPDSIDDNQLLGRPALVPGEETQLSRLLAWLKDCQERLGNVPKFIVSPNVFVPNNISERTGAGKTGLDKSDSWPAFPATRAAILGCIVDHGVQNVVFLSGDIHCANVAEMSFDGAGTASGIKAFAITSSAFYWPFPFADGSPSDYVHDSKASAQSDTFTISPGLTMDYRAWGFTQEDNFCQVAVDRANARIAVTAIDNRGRPIPVADEAGGTVMQSVLGLVRW
mgnify:CR=1 FL=1